ncbi:MAG: hypothetical protein ACI9U2_004485 [Bradymonadia bacterium]|jgi:hypothetical protein
MLILAALVLATPPLAPPRAPPLAPAAIAFRLADSSPAHRVELLKELSQLWSAAPWGTRALAAVEAGQRDTGVDKTSGPPEPLWDVGIAPDMKSLRAKVQRNDHHAHAENLINLARAHWRRGEPAGAKARLGEALAELRRTPDVEFNARAWDGAQKLCLQFGDFPGALRLLQHRASGRLDALNRLVHAAFDFDHTDQVLAALPVLFALRPGIDDDLPDLPKGCVDAMHPQRWTMLADWSKRLLVNGDFAAHQALVEATPQASMREALRARAAAGLLINERSAEAWAVIAQMGVAPPAVTQGVCAGIKAVGALRAATRIEFIENAKPPLLLKAIESAFELGESAGIAWDSVISSVEDHGDVAALAAIVGNSKDNEENWLGRLEWSRQMMLCSDRSLSVVRDILSGVSGDPGLIEELDQRMAMFEEEPREAPMQAEEPSPAERWALNLESANNSFLTNDRGMARREIEDAWADIFALDGEAGAIAAGDLFDLARLSILLGEADSMVKHTIDLSSVEARINALRDLGEAAFELDQPKVSVQAAQAIARTAKIPDLDAVEAADDPKVARCGSPTDDLVEGALEPSLADWVARGRLNVAAQIAAALPLRVRGRRLAALVVQMSANNQLREALDLARTVSRDGSGCAAGEGYPRDDAWLGLIDQALTHRRFEVARRAFIAMPHPRDIKRYADLARRLFDGLAEVEQMPDLSPVLGRPDGSAAVRAVIQREMLRQHLAQGRIGAALTVGKASDRRTRMRLLLALAREPDQRLAQHASAVEALEAPVAEPASMRPTSAPHH